MNQREVASEIQELKAFGEVVESFEEIAVTAMRKVRSSVLYSRYFVKGLTTINQEVKSSYSDEVEILMKKRKIKDPNTKLPLLKRNGKTISVFLSPNTGLYGSIVKKTYNEFYKYISENETDIMIMGRLGRVMYESSATNKKKYVFFDYPEKGTQQEIYKKTDELIIQYEKILVFYSLFENMSTQKPEVLDVYGNVPTVTIPKGIKTEYLFEPSLEKILLFFEKEIFATIFSQAVKESDLARFASRILTLDSAAENVREKLKRYSILEETIKHRIMNKKQQESLAGMALW